MTSSPAYERRSMRSTGLPAFTCSAVPDFGVGDRGLDHVFAPVRATART